MPGAINHYSTEFPCGNPLPDRTLSYTEMARRIGDRNWFRSLFVLFLFRGVIHTRRIAQAANRGVSCRMTVRRPEPPPPQSDPPSILLLRAIGGLQRNTGASRILPDAIAARIGHDPVDISPLIRRGIAAGYLVYVAGAVGLSTQGWTWYNWDKRRRA